MPEPGLDPRSRRLLSERARLEDLAAHSALFSIEAMEGEPPEYYVVVFTCTGVIGVRGLRPILGNEHRVSIRLGAGYPMQGPVLRWLTPLFHPNVTADGRFVCISTWHPASFLDQLCHMLARMIQYRNYDPNSAFRADAAQWSVQAAAILPVDTRPLRSSGSPDQS